MLESGLGIPRGGDALHAGLKLRHRVGGELLEIAAGMTKNDMALGPGSGHESSWDDGSRT